MTKEEKQILLHDLCARLPYGVICLVEFSDDRKYAAKLTSVSVTNLGFGSSGVAYLHCCKPYLRPMSSMTEEENEEWIKASNMKFDMEDGFVDVYDAHLSIDYLNSHHIDYRGLIPMGLALKAPEDMYK